MNGSQSMISTLAATPGILLKMQIKPHPKPTKPETLGNEHNMFQ